MLPSYKSLQKHLQIIEFRDQKTISMNKERFRELLIELASREEFDEEWYLRTYPDVAEAVKLGKVESAKKHFVETGYFEGRLPSLNGFDVAKYTQKNTDLRGMGRDEALQHFINAGYQEGRPY